MGIIKKQSIQSTLIQYLGAGIGFLNRIIIFTFFLTTEEIGLANILLTTGIMLATFAVFGFESMTLKYFPYFNDKERGHHNFLFWLLAIPTVAYAILTIGIVIFQVPIMEYFRAKSPEMIEYFWYLPLIGLSQMYYILFDSYLRSLFKTVVPEVFRQIVQRLLISFSVILYGFGWIDFPTFVLVYVILISSVTLLMVAYTFYLGQLHLETKQTWRIKKLSKRILIYGGFAFLGNVSSVIIFNIDSLMLASYEGMDAVGVYTTAFYVSVLIHIPWRALLKITAPKVSELWKLGDMFELNKLYKRVTAINFAIGCLLFGLMTISLDCLFGILPPDYANGYSVILIIAGARVFDMLTGLNGTILMTSKYFRIDLFLNMSLMILAVLLNMILIPTFKIEGAAWATAFALSAANAFRIVFVWVKFKLQPFTGKILLIAICSAAAFAVQYWILLDINEFVLAAIKGTIFAVPLLASFVYFKIIPAQMLRGKFN